MRVSGSFQDVYVATKNWSNGGEIYGGMPINPVVRFANGIWMLESALDPEPNAEIEVTMDEFESWFYEMFKTDENPTESIIAEFKKAVAE